jgi:hypothetical protein
MPVVLSLPNSRAREELTVNLSKLIPESCGYRVSDVCNVLLNYISVTWIEVNKECFDDV